MSRTSSWVGLICTHKLNNPNSRHIKQIGLPSNWPFNAMCELLTAATFHSYKQHLMVVGGGGGGVQVRLKKAIAFGLKC